jgi:hypothetical protein
MKMILKSFEEKSLKYIVLEPSTKEIVKKPLSITIPSIFWRSAKMTINLASAIMIFRHLSSILDLLKMI